jgi:transposase
MEIDPKNLPKNIEQCHAIIAEMVKELDAKDRRAKQLQHLLEELLRWRYGPRRERVDENQMFLFAAGILGTDKEIPTAPPEAPGQQPKHTPHGRQRLPKHLPRKRVVHDLSESERHCPQCHGGLKPIGEEVSERLEYVLASLYVIEEVCEKYACEKGCTVVTAQKPMQPIEKGLPGPGLLAHVVVRKYRDHLPLHRQEGMFEREGVKLSRSTMCDWMGRCAELVTPLFELMKDRVLSGKIMQTPPWRGGGVGSGLTQDADRKNLDLCR